MDDFKQHLKLHEAELDTEKPGVHVWEQLKLKTGKPASRIFAINNLWKYAAVIILLTAIGMTIKYILPAKKDHLPEVIAIKTDRVPAPPTDTILITPTATIQLKEVKKTGVKKPAVTIANPAMHKTEIIDQLEKNYTQLVNYQMDRIRHTAVYAEAPGYFDSFKIQFSGIEKNEAALKEDILQNGLNEILLDKLIEVYQQKLNVLKSFQTAIRKINNRVQLLQKDSALITHYYITL